MGSPTGIALGYCLWTQGWRRAASPTEREHNWHAEFDGWAIAIAGGATIFSPDAPPRLLIDFLTIYMLSHGGAGLLLAFFAGGIGVLPGQSVH